MHVNQYSYILSRTQYRIEWAATNKYNVQSVPHSIEYAIENLWQKIRFFSLLVTEKEEENSIGKRDLMPLIQRLCACSRMKFV